MYSFDFLLLYLLVLLKFGARPGQFLLTATRLVALARRIFADIMLSGHFGHSESTCLMEAVLELSMLRLG